jgi:uncharacterized protein
LVTDFTGVGRVAQFGRGIMEEVSKRLVGQMADCIRSTLEAAEQATAPAAELPADPAPRVQVSAPPSPAATPESQPLDAVALARSVAMDRLRAAGPGRLAGIAVGVFAVFLLARRLRRR